MEKATIQSLHNSPDESPGSDQQAIKADRDLARRAGNGDRRAFQDIVDGNKQRMFTVARSVIGDAALAEDIVQEAFIKAYRALADFRGDCLLSTWLYRITYLTAIDAHRQQKRLLQLATDNGEQVDVEDPNLSGRSDVGVESSQLRREIDAAMKCLSPFEQTVFTLRHMQNFKLREIAEVVDRSEGTVKNILFRAIRKMRERLDSTYIMQEIETC